MTEKDVLGLATEKATRSPQTILYWYCEYLSKPEVPVAVAVFCDN